MLFQTAPVICSRKWRNTRRVSAPTGRRAKGFGQLLMWKYRKVCIEPISHARYTVYLALYDIFGNVPLYMPNDHLMRTLLYIA